MDPALSPRRRHIAVHTAVKATIRSRAVHPARKPIPLKHRTGQVLVIHDMLGINKGFSPRFLRRYADLHEVMTGAVTSYVEDVKSGDFPNESEQY